MNADDETRIEDVRGYYEDLTSEYLRYGGDMGWHYGVWEAGAHTHRDSLERASARIAVSVCGSVMSTSPLRCCTMPESPRGVERVLRTPGLRSG